MISPVAEIRHAFGLLRWGDLCARFGTCPLCGPTVFLRIRKSVVAVRCLRCLATPIHMAIVSAIRREVRELSRCRAYEMSSRGPVVEFLRREAKAVAVSEYFDDVAPGDTVEGIPCQDVERLTFPAGSFDLCTCTEVFEHVPDDGAGFREVCRVLASGGRFLFTVPLLDRHETVERARREGAGVVHLMDPEYHGDRIRGRGGVLAFRTYGRDILGRLARAGFASGEVVHVADPSGLSEGYPVVIGRKGGE